MTIRLVHGRQSNKEGENRRRKKRTGRREEVMVDNLEKLVEPKQKKKLPPSLLNLEILFIDNNDTFRYFSINHLVKYRLFPY